jgi:hypothetical protein
MVAAIRPDAWNLPLFLHVLGAMLTFGAVGAVALLSFAARGRVPEQGLLLRRWALWTGLLGVVPAFVLMRVAAQWIADKEYPGNAKTPGWLDVGFIVTGAGRCAAAGNPDPRLVRGQAREIQGRCRSALACLDLPGRPRHCLVRDVRETRVTAPTQPTRLTKPLQPTQFPFKGRG